MKRYGSIIGLRPEKKAEYIELHKAVWPDVLRRIQQCQISNYSIFLRQLDDGRLYLFAYFEYTGADFKTDMAKMAADPATQRWWALCKPCQQPLAACTAEEWWADMEEVFNLEEQAASLK
jgi:L-rhamnose mutarotase